MEEALIKALQWWNEECEYLTTGDYGEHNVFDEPPEWVAMARIALSKLHM